jgi:plasmid maintenance system antidote protein VapI
MRQEGIAKLAVDELWIEVGRRLLEQAGGRNALAKKLGFAPSKLTRVFNRSKPMTAEIIAQFERLIGMPE